MGGNDEVRKMALVKWDKVLLKIKKGGLNVGSLKAFKWALLWKMLVRFRPKKINYGQEL